MARHNIGGSGGGCIVSCPQDKVAIVTGSSRGLGRAIACELADHGCKVVINYYQSKDLAAALAKEMKKKGQDAFVVQAGVAHPDECQRLVEETVKRFGGLDILVNNAGVNRDRTIRRMATEEWREVLATDLDSVFYCTYAALPHMIERGGGRIVNMSSIVGQMGNLGQSNYAAAKAGMVTNLTEDVQQALIAKIPLGRFGSPEEVARLCRFLVAEGDYITGAQININGGMYLQ